MTQPTEPYTSQATVDLVVTVPAALIGDRNHRIRLYLTLPNQVATPIRQEHRHRGSARTIILGVQLTDGINDFSVSSIIGSSGESDKSLLSSTKVGRDHPEAGTIVWPKNNGVSSMARSNTDWWQTQARPPLLVLYHPHHLGGEWPAPTATSRSARLAAGTNKIVISGTDPAGNQAETTLTVRRGTGKLMVALTASAYQIKRSRLPSP